MRGWIGMRRGRWLRSIWRRMVYLIETETHVHNVGHSQRSGVVVEPLVSNQWFVDTADLAAEAARVVDDGEVKIIPPRSKDVYLHWMENIRPWCISRQLWWGHRIPAWYCRCWRRRCDHHRGRRGDHDRRRRAPDCRADRPDRVSLVRRRGFRPGPRRAGHVVLGRACGRTRRWAGPTPTRTTRPTWARFYPSSVMETGYDILFFWVAPDDYVGLLQHGRGPVPHGLPARSGARRAGPQDVEGRWTT